LRHDGLLYEMLEGGLRRKPTRGWRRNQMVYELANDGGFLLHSNGLRTEGDGDTEKGYQKPAVQQKTTD